MRQRPLGGVGTWFPAPTAELGTVALDQPLAMSQFPLLSESSWYPRESTATSVV